MSSTLQILKKYTTIVADTGDFEAIKKFSPLDSTTNPSLILSAVKLPQYAHLMDKAIEHGKKKQSLSEQIDDTFDMIFVLFGCEILKVVPGRVSTEVDARYSFSIDKQVEVARRLIAMYADLQVPKERVLIKLSSTWEGIKAAEILQSKYGIHCNMTLLFSLHQAIACAEAGVQLISPFVGRVLDWHLAKFGKQQSFDRLSDPGVKLVTQIYNYYKLYDYKTEIMGASFRNVDEVLGLVGCDLLTVSPALLAELAQMTESLEPILTVEKAKSSGTKSPVKPISESEFRWFLNEDEMAHDKLSDGIRRFAKDAETLRDLIKARLLA